MARTKGVAAAVLVFMSVALGACERSELNGIGSNTPADVAPPQLDLIGAPECSVREWGWVSGEGEIRNGATGVSTYEVVVGFYDGNLRLADQSTWIRDVDPGETARFEANVWLNDDASAVTSCEAVTINRWSISPRS